MLAAFSEPLPEEGMDPAAVVRDLAERAEPGLMASGSGRFLGWVIGGALPAAIAADWLVSAWDQNSAMSEPFPATTMIEQVVAGWVLDLLDLPRGASVGFVTGGQMANTACLAAARNQVLAAHGWDVERDGLQGAPGSTCWWASSATTRSTRPARDRPRRVHGGSSRRTRPAGCGRTPSRRPRPGVSGPTIVCAQAGNVNGGGVDPVGEIVEAVRREDLWVHLDGAFGLWARAAPAYRHLAAGAERADSWATDAHKWLNTPYDCGIAICAHPAAHRRAMGVRAAYLPHGDDAGLRDPIDYNPELSRRARSVPVWAALRQLGRGRAWPSWWSAAAGWPSGSPSSCPRPTASRCCTRSSTRLVVRFLDPAGRDHDAHSRAVVARAQAEGTCYPSATVWRGVGERACR